MMRMKKISNEVFYAEGPFLCVGAEEVQFLKGLVGETEYKRIRLCSHRDIEDTLHEMLIVLLRETYIRPAKHIGRAESLHIIEGEADAVFFDEAGQVTRVIGLGDYASGKAFYYRMAEPTYHTLLVRSPSFVFHEATLGPFRIPETIQAPWAPAESDTGAVKAYLESLNETVTKRLEDERRKDNRTERETQ